MVFYENSSVCPLRSAHLDTHARFGLGGEVAAVILWFASTRSELSWIGRTCHMERPSNGAGSSSLTIGSDDRALRVRAGTMRKPGRHMPHASLKPSSKRARER